MIPQKVHIYLSIDTLDSATVKRIAAEHDALDSFSHIEWVNDTEANFVYHDSDAATQALYALTQPGGSRPEDIPLMDERPAKPFSGAQGVEMMVRMARATDVKKKGAAAESRFYLFHPEKDPIERQRRRELAMKRRRDWDGEAGNYTRNRFDDMENKRRQGQERWEASMYDDNDGTEMDVEGEERRKRVRFSGRRRNDLFAYSDRDEGRLRGRSASPPRDGDGRYGFGTDDDDTSAIRRKIRQRSQTPPRLRSNGYNSNAGKDLFSNSVARDRVLDTRRNAGKELFPNQPLRFYPNAGKELFGNPNAGKELFSNPNAGKDLFRNSNTGKDLFDRHLFRDTNPSTGKDLFARPSSSYANPNAGKDLFPPNPRHSFNGDDLSIAGASLRRRGSNHRRTDAIDASPRMSNTAASLSPELKPRLSLADRITSGPAGRRINGAGSGLAARVTRDGGGLEGRITRDGEGENPNAARELFGVRRRSMLSS